VWKDGVLQTECSNRVLQTECSNRVLQTECSNRVLQPSAPDRVLQPSAPDRVLQTECSRPNPSPLTSLPGGRSCSPALSVTDGEPDQRAARGGGYANVARWCERDALNEQSSTYAWMRYKDNVGTELCFFVDKTIATWLQSVPNVTRQCILVSKLDFLTLIWRYFLVHMVSWDLLVK
jgi:hypothetical protein